MKFQRSIFSALGILLAVGLAGCGDDNDETSSPGTGQAPTNSTSGWTGATAQVNCDFANIRSPNRDGGDRARQWLLLGNAPGNAIDNAALECGGPQALTFTVAPNGSYTISDGRTGQLESEELAKLSAGADAFLSARPDLQNIQCESSADVQRNQVVYLSGPSEEKTYLFASDDTAGELCYVGTREQAMGLQEALQTLFDRHGTGSGETETATSTSTSTSTETSATPVTR